MAFWITERKAAEVALQHSELRFRDIYSVKVAMLLFNPDTGGSIVGANTAASDYYGYPVDQPLPDGVSAINTLTPEQIAEEMRRAGEERSHFHFQHRLASGEVRDVEVHSGPLNWMKVARCCIPSSTTLPIGADFRQRRRKLSQAVEQAQLHCDPRTLRGASVCRLDSRSPATPWKVLWPEPPDTEVR